MKTKKSNRGKKTTRGNKVHLILLICLVALENWGIDALQGMNGQNEDKSPQIGVYASTEQIAEDKPKTEEVQEVADEMEISYYSELDSCHYPTNDGCLTASGKIAEVGMVATNLYSFGTRLLIDGKEYVVEDRISKRYNNRIDIFVGYGQRAYNQAKESGIKKYKVSVIN